MGKFLGKAQAITRGGFFGGAGGWTAQASPVNTPLTGIASNGAGVLILTDQFLHVYRSTNGGVTWTLVATLNTGVPGFFFALNYSHGVFIIAGDGAGKIFRSTDQGLTWSALIATGLGTSVSAGAGDGAGNWLITSNTSSEVTVSANDGLTWTAHATTARQWNFAATLWDGAQWVSTGEQAVSAATEVITSPDGFTLTETVFVPAATESFNNTLAFQGGIYVCPTSHLAVRRSATTPAALATNADIAVPLTGAGGIATVVAGNGKWFAFDFNGGVANSTDALIWSATTGPLNFVAGDFCVQCVYDATHGVFVAIGGNSGSISTHT
jgi:hypothetical protein